MLVHVLIILLVIIIIGALIYGIKKINKTRFFFLIPISLLLAVTLSISLIPYIIVIATGALINNISLSYVFYLISWHLIFYYNPIYINILIIIAYIALITTTSIVIIKNKKKNMI